MPDRQTLRRCRERCHQTFFRRGIWHEREQLRWDDSGGGKAGSGGLALEARRPTPWCPVVDRDGLFTGEYIFA